MTEQELRDLTSKDLVRIVTNDKKFHLVSTDNRFCSPTTAPTVMLGHVACWCMTEAKWISVNPLNVFAFEALGHTADETTDVVPG